MRIYTIHLPPPFTGRDKPPEALRRGFSLPACLFTFAWALWHGMWRLALVLFAIGLVLGGIGHVAGLDETGQGIVSLAFMVWVGLEANDWRRAHLARRGWREEGPVAAANVDGALRRYGDLSALDAEAI